MKTYHGYTLIEVLLAIAFMGIIVGIGIPLSQSFMHRSDLSTAVSAFVQGARRAETLARAGDGDASWGVYATTGSVTVFQGPNYSGRNVDEDEVYTVPESLSISGITEYVFAKMTGYPTVAGTTTFSFLPGNEKTITINAKGTTSY